MLERIGERIGDALIVAAVVASVFWIWMLGGLDTLE